MLHGAMIIPSVRNDPDEMDAAWSPLPWCDVGERRHLARGVGRLQLDRRARPARHDQVGLDVGEVAEQLQQADPERGSGRSRDADDQPHGLPFSCSYTN